MEDKRLDLYNRYYYLVSRYTERYELTDDEENELEVTLFELCTKAVDQGWRSVEWVMRFCTVLDKCAQRCVRKRDIAFGCSLNDFEDVEDISLSSEGMCEHAFGGELWCLARNILSELDYKILFLLFRDECTYEEIGRVVGLSQERVRQRLVRALTLLRTCFEIGCTLAEQGFLYSESRGSRELIDYERSVRVVGRRAWVPLYWFSLYGVPMGRAMTKYMGCPIDWVHPGTSQVLQGKPLKKSAAKTKVMCSSGSGVLPPSVASELLISVENARDARNNAKVQELARVYGAEWWKVVKVPYGFWA